MPPASVLMKSGRFSFGTEIFLIMALSVDAPDIALPMLSFRLLHFFGTILLMTFLFGPSGIVRWLSCLLKDGPALRSFLNVIYWHSSSPSSYFDSLSRRHEYAAIPLGINLISMY